MDIDKLDKCLVDVIKSGKYDNNLVDFFYGQMGICAALYMSNKRNSNMEIEQLADKFLDCILEKTKTIVDTSFEHGLSGIGFAINFLHKEGCISGDIDDILFSIDASIYKQLNDDEIKVPPHLNGFIGYLAYIVERIENPFHNKESLLHEIDMSMLRRIINNLYLLMPVYLKKLNEDLSPTFLSDCSILFYYFGRLLHANVYNEKIKKMISNLEVYVCSVIPHYNLNKILIANTLSYLNEKLRNESVKKYIKILYDAVEYEKIINEIDRGVNSFNVGWCNALINITIALKYIEDNDKVLMLYSQREKISSYADKCINEILTCNNNNVKANFINGISGVSFALSILLRLSPTQLKRT
ncbi:MAG: hypothetical protein K5874_03600 [Bacteroidaceae bacterium]|nr:hypothetical protein [Bacteroidaceae bacterium]